MDARVARNMLLTGLISAYLVMLTQLVFSSEANADEPKPLFQYNCYHPVTGTLRLQGEANMFNAPQVEGGAFRFFLGDQMVGASNGTCFVSIR